VLDGVKRIVVPSMDRSGNDFVRTLDLFADKIQAAGLDGKNKIPPILHTIQVSMPERKMKPMGIEPFARV
jgi:hypothetical protein